MKNNQAIEVGFSRKARWVSELIAADKVPPEMVTPDLVLAYFDEVGRRIEKIQTIYLTRDGASQAMQNSVLSLCKTNTN